MKKIALIAVPALSLALIGAITAGAQTAECRACEPEENPVAVCRDDDNDYTQSGVDNFLPDDDVFGRDNDLIGDGRGRTGGTTARPRPRDGYGNRRRPIGARDAGESPNGDIYFVIYGHFPLPPAPQPPVTEDGGSGEIPEAELG